jgi:hypothetical protein
MVKVRLSQPFDSVETSPLDSSPACSGLEIFFIFLDCNLKLLKAFGLQRIVCSPSLVHKICHPVNSKNSSKSRENNVSIMGWNICSVPGYENQAHTVPVY